jgi:hypothetical protein
MRKKFGVVAAVCLGIAISAAVCQAQTWVNLGGTTIAGNPVAVTDRVIKSQDYLDIYAVWTDGTVRVKGQQFSCHNRSGHPICGPFFGGWVNLGGAAAYPPAAVGWNNHREVFAVATDFQLYHDYTDNTTWSGWQPLGAPAAQLCSRPSAVSWAPGRMDVFVLGCDNNLWHTWFDHGWHGWEIPSGSGPTIATAPTAASSEPGSLEVVAADFDGEVHAIGCTDSLCNNAQSTSWGAWEDTGMQGCNTANAAPVYLGKDVHFLYSAFIESCNNLQLLGEVRNAEWQPAAASGVIQSTGSSMQAVLASDFTNFVFYRDAANHVAYQRWLNNRWLSQDDNAIGSDVFASDPAPVAGNNAVFMVAGKADGSIWYTFINPAAPPTGFPTLNRAAWTGSNYASVGLNHFNATSLVEQDSIPQGSYLVNAKAAISNADGDYQDAECQIVVEDTRNPQNPPVLVSDARIRIGKQGEGDTQPIALRGYFISNDPATPVVTPYRFRLTCGTYNGSASEAVLTVIKVSRINHFDGLTTRVAVGGTPLGGFTPTTVASFKLASGNYIIHAKAELQNIDGDAQNGECSLIATPLTSPSTPIMFDRTFVRPEQLQHSDHHSLVLQGAFCAVSPIKLELDCDTYNGGVNNGVLTAMPVNSACPQ